MLSFKCIVETLLQRSKRILLYQRKQHNPLSIQTRPGNSLKDTNKLSQRQTDGRLARGVGLYPSQSIGVVRRLLHNVLRRVNPPAWGVLSGQGQNFGRILGNASPYFALVGVSLTAWPQDKERFTSHGELESVCGDIREAVSRAGWIHDPAFWRSHQTKKTESRTPHTYSINDYKLGPVIDKGCNAVVYAAASLLDTEETSTPAPYNGDTTTRLPDTEQACALPTESVDRQPGPSHSVSSKRKFFFKGSFLKRKEDKKRKAPEELPSSGLVKDDLKEYPLAIKMMFNYDAESNFGAIFNSMHREVLPASYLQISEGFMDWKKRFAKDAKLPPHANIVDMPCVFVDMVPLLPEGSSMYPNALPKRLHTEGFGRNMSMFCVMKRYDCTLGQYLRTHKPDSRTAVVLLTQLLEAILHLNSCDVAHRDLKLDNILLCMSEGACYPKLVVTDFGCCFADQSARLSVPFSSYEFDPRLGNAALMAPEVKTALPGLLRTIDYSRSDIWSIGVLALQLLGVANPFYSHGNQPAQLDSASYQEHQLPKLPKSVPIAIRDLINGLLQCNPKNRPSPTISATICQLYLWAPAKWTSRSSAMPSDKEITQWLLCVSTKILCEAGGPISTDNKQANLPEGKGASLEYEMVSTLLSRIHYVDIIRSLQWIKNA